MLCYKYYNGERNDDERDSIELVVFSPFQWMDSACRRKYSIIYQTYIQSSSSINSIIKFIQTLNYWRIKWLKNDQMIEFIKN